MQGADNSNVHDICHNAEQIFAFHIIPPRSCFPDKDWTGKAVSSSASWSVWCVFLIAYNYRACVCVCIFVRAQMCVTVPQLTGEWKLFPADVSSLPATCTSSSPTISSTGKRSVIVAVNNIIPSRSFYFHLARFVQLSTHEDLRLYISFKNPFKSTRPYVQAEERWLGG